MFQDNKIIISSNTLKARVTRANNQFKEDSRIPEIFRATLKDYKGTGYDRGHLAPAANHLGSEEAVSDTFFLSNICPQDPAFNRGYWLKLEKHIRNLTQEYQTIEIYTGPLFMPQEDKEGNRIVLYRVIGKNDVAVPTHFYKVLFLHSTNGEISELA